MSREQRELDAVTSLRLLLGQKREMDAWQGYDGVTGALLEVYPDELLTAYDDCRAQLADALKIAEESTQALNEALALAKKECDSNDELRTQLAAAEEEMHNSNAYAGSCEAEIAKLKEERDLLRTRAERAERERDAALMNLHSSRKIRRYVAFVLTGDENADVQVAADQIRTRAERAESNERRYLWLKERFHGVDWDYDTAQPRISVLTFKVPDDMSVSANLDATIDAALSTPTDQGA